MRGLWGFGFGGLLLSVMSSPSGRAELITFSFEGHVTELLGDVGFLGNSIQVGTTFAGTYTFDSTTPDGIPVPEEAEYDNSLTAFSLQLGPHLLVGTGLYDQIQIGNEPPPAGDLYYVQDRSSQLLGRNVIVTMGFQDSAGLVFASDALPLTPPPLDVFDDMFFHVADGLVTFAVQGRVTSLVPEPAAVVLIMLGGVFITRRRR